MTKEHVWSDWLNSALKLPISPTDKHSRSIISTRCEDGVWIIQPKQTVHNGQLQQRKLRNVCRQCNNGWMSQIVDAAKPFVADMILGNPTSIDFESQANLAAWLALTTIMAEFTDVENACVPECDRRFLLVNREPPQSWTILLGKYIGKDHPPMKYRHIGNGFVPTRAFGIPLQGQLHSPEKMQVTLFIMRFFFVIVCSSTIDFAARRLRSQFGAYEGMLQLWPRVSHVFVWPQDSAIGDHIVDKFDALTPFNLADGLFTHFGGT